MNLVLGLGTFKDWKGNVFSLLSGTDCRQSSVHSFCEILVLLKSCVKQSGLGTFLGEALIIY